MQHPNSEIMLQAISLAKESIEQGGFGVGAIIVKGDEIIAAEFDTIKQDQDPTSHPELKAIRIAAKKLGSKKLTDCYLYTTYEPCPMCSSAAIWARMNGIVYGASHLDATANSPWRIVIPAAEVLSRGTPTLELYPDFMRDECKSLLLVK